MANSKIKTLWTISGRANDSREVLDSNGGLRVGRIDIPASMMVVVEGYSKVEYQRTDSQGNVSKYDSIMEALTVYGKEPIVETKSGSGVMTFFVDGSDSTYAGFVQIDVYKEWEDVDPEPDPIKVDDIKGMSSRGLGVVKRADAFGLGGVGMRTDWTEVGEGGFSGFVAINKEGAGSVGLNTMGISVSHTPNYTWQIAGRNGKTWQRWQEMGVWTEWQEVGAGGSSFDPEPLIKRIDDLEATNKSLSTRLGSLEFNDKTTQDTLRSVQTRLRALEEKPTE